MGQEVIFDSAIEQLQCAVGIQGFWQAPFAFGRAQAIGRVMVAQAFAVEITVQAAYGRQQASQAARGLPLLVQAGNQSAQLLGIQGAPVAYLLLGAVGEYLLQISPVGFQSVRRHLTLTAQVRAESFQLRLHG
ncbi:hypothetical protein D3C81_1614540 [compost metagenome]